MAVRLDMKRQLALTPCSVFVASAHLYCELTGRKGVGWPWLRGM